MNELSGDEQESLDDLSQYGCDEEEDLVFAPLEVVQLKDENIDCTNIRLWRLNLFATSAEDPSKSYVAINNKIKIISDIATQTLQTQIDINAIIIGKLGFEEILVVVGDQGIVLVYFTMNIERKPITLMNDSSTWGSAVKGSFIAISDNAYKVKIWNMISNEHQNEYILQGHEHNIPCVDISSKGILVSCSIDRTCRVWDVLKQQQLAIFRNEQWNWKTIIIETCDVKRVCNEDPVFEFLDKINYAKPLISISSESLAEFDLSDSEDGQVSTLDQNEIQDDIMQEEPNRSMNEESMGYSSQQGESQDESDDNFSLDQYIYKSTPITKIPSQIYLLADHEHLFILQNSNPMSIITCIDLIPEHTNNQMQRISFIKWLPELSLCVIASPTGLVFLSRVVKSETRIGVIFERVIYNDDSDVVLGLDVVRFIGEGFKLSILFASGKILNFKINGALSA
jgi:WD40 repeat protein